MPRKNSLFSYTLARETGLAPNPDGRTLTLAVCKGPIRQRAQVGDWILGLSGCYLNNKFLDNKKGSTKIIHLMRINEIVKFEDYDKYVKSKNLSIKRAGITKTKSVRGDSYYVSQKNGAFLLKDSLHGPKNIVSDFKGSNVLVSRNYWYFGKEAISLPNKFYYLKQNGQGYKRFELDESIEKFISHIRDNPDLRRFRRNACPKPCETVLNFHHNNILFNYDNKRKKVHYLSSTSQHKVDVLTTNTDESPKKRRRI